MSWQAILILWLVLSPSLGIITGKYLKWRDQQ